MNRSLSLPFSPPSRPPKRSRLTYFFPPHQLSQLDQLGTSQIPPTQERRGNLRIWAAGSGIFWEIKIQLAHRVSDIGWVLLDFPVILSIHTAPTGIRMRATRPSTLPRILPV
eukprot:1340480-Amorphochlora_amoeboformis.AAC.1